MNKIFIPLFAFLFFSKMLAAQMDTVPPVVVCKTNLNLPLFPGGSVTAWAPDFLDTFFDNTNANIELGIRKICTGDNFPENQNSVFFSGGEMGSQKVEAWARDMAGNTAFCTMQIEVVDLYGSIDPAYSLILLSPENEGVSKSTVRVKGTHCLYDSVDYQIDIILSPWGSVSGYWSKFGSFVPAAGYNFSVTPSKNINPLNGVTTNDLVLIQKHILGIELFDSPWKLIAADANQDGKVTTSDIIVLRKLILGVTAELPNGKSWRFLPLDYTFPNPANPFLPPFPERIEVPNTTELVPSDFAFRGVKIGDVDFSADPNQ